MGPLKYPVSRKSTAIDPRIIELKVGLTQSPFPEQESVMLPGGGKETNDDGSTLYDGALEDDRSMIWTPISGGMRTVAQFCESKSRHFISCTRFIFATTTTYKQQLGGDDNTLWGVVIWYDFYACTYS